MKKIVSLLLCILMLSSITVMHGSAHGSYVLHHEEIYAHTPSDWRTTGTYHYKVHTTSDGWNCDVQFNRSSCSACQRMPEETRMFPEAEKGKPGVSWGNAILLGVFAFGVAVTTTVIVLKKRSK